MGMILAACGEKTPTLDVSPQKLEKVEAPQFVEALCFDRDKNPSPISLGVYKLGKGLKIAGKNYIFERVLPAPDDGVTKELLEHKSVQGDVLVIGYFDEQKGGSNGWWKNGDAMVMVWDAAASSKGPPSSAFACPSLTEKAEFYMKESMVSTPAVEKRKPIETSENSIGVTNQQKCFERQRVAKMDCATAGNINECIKIKYPDVYADIIISYCEYIHD